MEGEGQAPGDPFAGGRTTATLAVVAGRSVPCLAGASHVFQSEATAAEGQAVGTMLAQSTRDAESAGWPRHAKGKSNR